MRLWFSRNNAKHRTINNAFSNNFNLIVILQAIDIQWIWRLRGNNKAQFFVRLSGSASRLLWKLIQHESKLEAELLQSEKLAGIGSFAAGIAHDINNPLQLIFDRHTWVHFSGDFPVGFA